MAEQTADPRVDKKAVQKEVDKASVKAVLKDEIMVAAKGP